MTNSARTKLEIAAALRRAAAVLDRTALEDTMLRAAFPISSTEGVLTEDERQTLQVALVAAGFDGGTSFRSVRWAFTKMEEALEPHGFAVGGIRSSYAFSSNEGSGQVILSRVVNDHEVDINNHVMSVTWTAEQPDAYLMKVAII